MNKAFLTLAALTLSAAVTAQSLTPLQPDPEVLQGQLPNGLTYIIRHNEIPKGTAEFYIAQKVGAILEEDSQDGLAHFLEHMAFNGTKHFPGKGIINFLERVGVRFGEDINAYTSLDETVYTLMSVPTTDPAIVDSALLVLHDWSNFITLADEEIDKERGVIREEWRTSNSAGRRLFFGHMRKTMEGTPYAKRDVIGDTAVINNFKYEDLRSYYKKWYRPDLQGIIVVGDIDPKEIEAKIKSLWEDIPAPTNAAERTYFKVPLPSEPVISILADPENTRTSLTISYRYLPAPDSVDNSEEYSRVVILKNLAARIFNTRMNDLILQGAPFSRAYMYDTDIVPTLRGVYFGCTAQDGLAWKAQQRLLEEIEILRRYGVNQGELDRAAENLLATYKNAYLDRAKTESNSYVSEYYQAFLGNDIITSLEYEYELIQRLIPTIKKEDINTFVRSIFTASPVIEVSATEEDKEHFDADEYPALFTLLEKTVLQPYEEIVVDKNLVDEAPVGGKVIKTKKDKVYGVTILTLSNGITVWLKPTECADNEIRLNAFSNGGVALFPESQVLNASFASTVASHMGLGKYSATELNKALTGNSASASTSIGLYSDRISASSGKEDLETMFQLIYLQFGPRRSDPEAFESLMSRFRSQLANASKNPNMVFSDTLQTILADGNPYTPVLYKPEDLAPITLDGSLAAYADRFSSARGFTFAIVGSFDVDSITPLIEKWIGSLPTSKRKAKVVSRKNFSPQKDVSSDFSIAMQADKTRYVYNLSHKRKYSRREQFTLQILEEILNMRYFESVREDEGGSYGVRVHVSFSRPPVQEYTLQISFDTDPAAYDRLKPIITKEIEEIAKNGPRADDFDKVTKAMIKSRTEALQSNNSMWMALITNHIRFKDDDTNYTDVINSIKPEEIQAWAKRILDEANKVSVTMRPAAE